MPRTLAKQGISWHIKEFENHDKNTIRLPRHEFTCILQIPENTAITERMKHII